LKIIIRNIADQSQNHDTPCFYGPQQLRSCRFGRATEAAKQIQLITRICSQGEDV